MPTTTPANRFCPACGAPLSAGAKFCHRCGAPAAPGGEAGFSRAPANSAAALLPWGVAALALIALISLLAGQFFARRQPAAAAGTAESAPPAAGRAPDISAMSPQERADRLFQRVMQYMSDGKIDSARFFAPMALGALESIEPRTAHTRYDMGLVGFVVGDGTLAGAEADTILRANPTHLLGLILAASVADARGDSTARRGFEKRLLAAEPTEINKPLEEYADHANDIRAAVATARGRTPEKPTPGRSGR